MLKEQKLPERWALWAKLVGSSLAVSVAFLADWIVVFRLGKVMDNLVALEGPIAIDVLSPSSAWLVFRESIVGPSTMVAGAVAFVLVPAFWGWWAVRIKEMRLPVAERLVILVAALAIPVGVAAAVLCFLPHSARWGQFVCASYQFGHSFMSWLDAALMLWVAYTLWDAWYRRKRS